MKHSIKGLCMGLCLCLLLPVLNVRAESTEDRIKRQKAIEITSNSWPDWPGGPVVTAESAILMDADTGVILYEKNIHQKQYPASTTKILTTLIIAERCELDERVTFSREAVFDTPRDSNHIAMDVGQELSIEDCLNAILIRSANEVCFACAEHITGTTWQDFADIMNEKAAELGCVDSHFVNPNGLPDENHYTSAYDLATIGRAFFANEMLCQISISPRLHILPSENQPNEKIENSKNELLPGKKYAYEYLVGAKTGYTDTARSALVTCAEKDGMKLICVVLHDEAPYQYEDTLALFNYGFNNFTKVNVASTDEKYNITNSESFYNGYDIFGDSGPLLSLNKNAAVLLPKTITFDSLTSEVSYDHLAPGQAALINYYYQDMFLGSASLDIPEKVQTAPNDAVTETEILTSAPQREKILVIDPRLIFPVIGILLLLILLIILKLKNQKNAPSFSDTTLGIKSSRSDWKRQKRKDRFKWK